MTDSSNSSYPPLPSETWPAELSELRGSFAEQLNIYKTMAHHPALLQSWAALRAHIVTENALGPELQEVCILRTGYRLGSSYEWNHHVSRSRAIGMKDARIFSITGPFDQMAGPDAVIAKAVDRMIDTAELSTALQTELVALVGTKGMFDLIATVGFYKILGTIANSFDVPLDAGIEPHDLAD